MIYLGKIVKQRIRVAGIIQNGREVLIMKKAQGRVDGVPVWEIPTGKIKFGEQPEEAMDRMLEEFLGIELTEKNDAAGCGDVFGTTGVQPVE